MDSEQLNKALEEFSRSVKQAFEALGELIRELAEKIGEILEECKKSQNKVKYKTVKSLIKPYKQPFIKVRYRARDNL
jgi:hypothetical protein